MVASPIRYIHIKSLEPGNVITFRKRFFADVIKDHEMRSSWIIRVGPNPMTSVLTRDTYRGHTEEKMI